jgi:cytochrome c biogenesis protein ResB
MEDGGQVLQRISQNIESGREVFDAWKKDHCEKLAACQEKASAEQSENEELIKKIFKEEQDLLKQAKQIALDHGVNHEKIVEIDQEIAALNCRMQTLPKILEEQQATINGHRKKIADLRKALIKAEKEAAHNMSEKRVGQQIFQERLGLRFERVDVDHLRVVFNNITAEDPDKEFWFAVHVDQQNVYQIGEGSCRPPVEELPEMLHKLNETNNFGSFVRQMRAKFVELTVR